MRGGGVAGAGSAFGGSGGVGEFVQRFTGSSHHHQADGRGPFAPGHLLPPPRRGPPPSGRRRAAGGRRGGRAAWGEGTTSRAQGRLQRDTSAAR